MDLVETMNELVGIIAELENKVESSFGYDSSHDSMQGLLKRLRDAFDSLEIHLMGLQTKVNILFESDVTGRLKKLETILNDPRNIVAHRMRDE